MPRCPDTVGIGPWVTAVSKGCFVPRSFGEAKVRVQGRECIVKVSPADEDYEAIGGIQTRLDFGCQWGGFEECLFLYLPVFEVN